MAEKKQRVDNEAVINEQATENLNPEENKAEEIAVEQEISELEKLKKEATEYKDKWMRSVAEFDNYKKRNAKLWQDAYTEGASQVILKILPVGDNLDFALNMELEEKTLLGLKNIKKQFTDTLKTLEVEEIDPTGEQFDPNIAEAVMQCEKGEGEESDTVKQTFLKGYKLKDKIIRYAKVSVIK